MLLCFFDWAGLFHLPPCVFRWGQNVPKHQQQRGAAGKLLALNEGALPFLLKACRGMVHSIGVFAFGGRRTRAMTAHPKRDPVSGCLHTFSAKCAMSLGVAPLHPLSAHKHSRSR